MRDDNSTNITQNFGKDWFLAYLRCYDKSIGSVLINYQQCKFHVAILTSLCAAF